MKYSTGLKYWRLGILLCSLLLPVVLPVHVVQAQGGYDCSSATGLPQSECEALVALYEATGGDDWKTSIGWLQTTTPCEWYGVTCKDEHVTELSLYSNNLQNDLPPEIGNLTALTSLYLPDNQLTSLPPEIGNLSKLTNLNLGCLIPGGGRNQAWNNLKSLPAEIGDPLTLTSTNLNYRIPLGAWMFWEGNNLTSLPAEIGNLSALKMLCLADNQLTSLPPEIGDLTALTELFLSYNQLTSLPPEIGDLTVSWLLLSDNQLTSLPPEIGNLATLEYFYLSNNQLTRLPPEIGKLTALTYFSIPNNQLIDLPPEIGNLAILEYLHLSHNQLTSLPSEIGNLTMMYLDLSHNQLMSLPSGITNLTVSRLNLSNNQLTSLPPEIGNLTVSQLDLPNNQLASLPPEIGNLTVSQLDLSNNQLTNLPPEIGNLTAAQLDLSNNQLTSLPPEIGNLTTWRLNLSYNQLISLPSEIGNLTNLEYLYLSSNKLMSLPPEIGNLTTLKYLYLSSNQLISLPPEIGDLTILCRLSLSTNKLTSLPPEVGNLRALEYLYLSSNKLTSLPPEIGNLTNLEHLYLSNNQLKNLPLEIGNLTHLGILNLSNNQLAGLPSEIGNLTALRYFYLSNNPLSGEMPYFMTLLTAIRRFSFYDTGWCVPDSGPIPKWLLGISEVYGTGQICGQGPGGLGGSVTQSNSAPVAGVQVDLYRPVTGSSWHYVTTTQTTAAGTYQFNGLGQEIDYRVHFVDPQHRYAPEYYDNRVTLKTATPVTVILGEPRTGIDAVLSPPQPPAATIETDGGSVTPNPVDGMVVINVALPVADDITVTRVVTCASGSPTSVTLTLTPPGLGYAMASTGGNRYQATIPGSAITQDGDLVVYATCGVTTTEMPIGHINLYNPNGTVIDAATGQPVAGATVTLYQVPGWLPKTGPDDNRPNTCESLVSKAPDAPWGQPAPTELGIVVNPDITTLEPALAYQVTGSSGYYGWDFGGWKGCWYVEVTSPGYYALTSPVVGGSSRIVDLDLPLVSSRGISLAKSATPVVTLTNGSLLTYTLVITASDDTPLCIYDPLSPGLVWQGFTGVVPSSFTYTQPITGSMVAYNGSLTGTVTLPATGTLSVSYVVQVDLPSASFVSEYAQVSNTAYYYFPDETLALMRPSNTVTHIVHNEPSFEAFLPLVLKGS